MKTFKRALRQLNFELERIEKLTYKNNMKIYNTLTMPERVDLDDLRYYLEDLNYVIQRMINNKHYLLKENKKKPIK